MEEGMEADPRNRVVTGAARTGRSRQKNAYSQAGRALQRNKIFARLRRRRRRRRNCALARSLARVLSLFSWSLLLLFTSLLIPNRHSFRALSSGEIFIVCGGRVSVYLFCFVPSYGGEVWQEWKTLV
ncbi:unnamed protein product [Sphagnum troendelagicum]